MPHVYIVPATLDAVAADDGNFTYASTIDPSITNLYGVYSHAAFDGTNRLPIAVIMHGWAEDTTSFESASLDRMAAYGAFVVALGMRGRDGASGDEDNSAREIYDIYDGIRYVIDNFDFVDPTQICVCGYSGGGGNALAFACKFPDAASYVVSHFGISDYGYDSEDGWYNNGAGASRQPTLQSWIGGTPTTAPDKYRARNALEAITNFTGGFLYLFHDEEDTNVPIVNSTNVAAKMDDASLTNYLENYTDAEDIPRWNHNAPNGNAGVRFTEAIWLQELADNTYPAWKIASSSMVTVLGYIKTKRFEIWLGDGRKDVATVVYNTVAGTYTVTPLTGSMTIHITQGTRTATRSINSETTLTVS